MSEYYPPKVQYPEIQPALEDCPDRQFALARIALVFVGIFFAYFSGIWRAGETNEIIEYCLYGYLILSPLIFASTIRDRDNLQILRMVTAFFDPLFAAGVFSYAGDKGVLLIFVFTWIPVTYGFRFGEKWLMVSSVFSSAALLWALFTAHYFSNASLLICGIFAGHVLVISYIGEVLRSYRKAQDRLAAISMKDSLTDLPNRRLFLEHLHHLMLTSRRSQRHIACFFIDLDGFKAINDKHGHGTGDKVLVQVAEVMKAQLRQGDIAARLSGDEFMYATECPEDHMSIVTVAERLLHGIERIASIDGHQITLSASIGIAFHCHTPGGRNPDPDKLISEADKSMYEAKASGKGKIVINKTILL